MSHRWAITTSKKVPTQLFSFSLTTSSRLVVVVRRSDDTRSLHRAMSSNQNTLAIASGDLADLVSSSGAATIYPNDDAVLAVLQARFRADLAYSRIGTTNLVAVNPYKTLGSVNDASAREYEERNYKDTSLPMADSPRPLQPHIYDMAARMYLLMRRRNETQSVVARYVVVPIASWPHQQELTTCAEESPDQGNQPVSVSLQTNSSVFRPIQRKNSGSPNKSNPSPLSLIRLAMQNVS